MARQGRASLAIFLVAVATTGFWSCGGSAEGPTSPVGLPESPAAAASAPVDDGGVTASAKGKVTICHKGQSQQVPPSAVGGHLGHGDRLGSCAPTPVDCPCFSASGLTDVAVQCSPLSLQTSCPEPESPYSLRFVCGGSTPLGLFEARLGTGTCSTLTPNLQTGEPDEVTKEVTPAQFEACRQAIVGSSFYPASCPR